MRSRLAVLPSHLPFWITRHTLKGNGTLQFVSALHMEMVSMESMLREYGWTTYFSRVSLLFIFAFTFTNF